MFMKMRRILLMFIVGISTIIVLSVINSGKQEIDYLSFLVPFVFAHCDTLDGPVVKAAQKALDTKNVDLILCWVQKKVEAEIKAAFEKTLAVRKLSPEAKTLADIYFFETLVRVHRASEGAPYTGLKPAGSEVDPAIMLADKTVESGNINNLVKKISEHLATELQEKFNRVIEKKKDAEKSVEVGREYVEAYVVFIHYVETYLSAKKLKPILQ